jgi:hypothetical protein
MKILLLFSIIMVFFITSSFSDSFADSEIPSWVKNNAGWWSEGALPDSDFVAGIQYLIEEGILKIPPTSQGTSSGSNGIPAWIKNNAGWWSEGALPDSDFLNGISFLIKEGILSTNQKTSSDESKDYTVLVYMVGNDLERNRDSEKVDLLATLDIEEMISGKPSSNVNVIVATGGSKLATPEEDSNRKIDFQKIKYHLINDKAQETKTVGKTSMGTSKNLSDFIISSVEKYPAEKFVLIFWGHGRATEGFGDDNIHDDNLSLVDLKKALGDAKEKTKTEFELIGFDSCLMATIEVANSLKDYGKYMVASEEVEVGYGWDYEEIIKKLNENPKQGGLELGQTIVTSFFKDVEVLSIEEEANYASYSTLSVLNLTKIDLINDKVKGLTEKAETLNEDDFPKFQQALNNAERFGQRAAKDSGQIDIKDFSAIISKNIPELKSEANSVIDDIGKVILINQAGGSHKNAHGLSVELDRTECTTSCNNIFGPTRGFVEFYSNHLKQDQIAPELKNLKLQDYKITGSYTDNDIYEINFYFTDDEDEDGILEIFSTDEYDADEFPPGTIDFEWDGYEPSLCNSKFCYPINPEWEWGETDMAYLPVIVYSDLAKEGLRGDLIYDVTKEGEEIFIGFWPVSHDEEIFTKNLLPLHDGNYVQIIATLEEWEAEEETEYYEPVERLLVDSEFRFSWEVYDWGPLNIWVEICDFSDNCSWSEEPFTIDPLDVADVDENDIIPYDQNDPLNENYDWDGKYEMKFYYDDEDGYYDDEDEGYYDDEDEGYYDDEDEGYYDDEDEGYYDDE